MNSPMKYIDNALKEEKERMVINTGNLLNFTEITQK